jgi:hypothetical protein
MDASENSQALSEKKAAAISQLRALAKECSVEDWDGYGAFPMDKDALRNAEAFIRALPENFPLPEFAPKPDGSFSLDWIPARQHVLTVCVDDSNQLAYAWLDDSDQGNGLARFDGSFVPRRVLDAIQTIMKLENHANAAIRVA